ncbi:MAG: hypothetical protein RIC56_07130 [Pseudomonadales bacterium]
MNTPKPLGCRNASLLVLAFGTLSACTSQPSEYAWSHLESGEYLFAFDTQACEVSSRNTQSAGTIRTPSVKASPAFFSCMQKLGYFLVDPATGEPIAPAADTTASLISVSDVQAGR